MILLIFLLIAGISFGEIISLKRVIEDTLKNNLELKAHRDEIKAIEYEYKSAKAMLFPNFRFEETFTRTDIPAFVLFTKLNQERITLGDFTPQNLNDPSSINNFETKFSLEIPLWMGGKIRAFKRIARIKKEVEEKRYMRKEEDMIFKAYEAYLNASLARSAIDTAKSLVKEAEEHVRIANKLYETGMALLSDVLRAEVFLRKAEEKLEEAKRNYETAKKGISLIANTDYTGYDVEPLKECPALSKEELIEKALKSREDLMAMKESLKLFDEGYKATLGEHMPHIFAFASYNLYDRDIPFGADGSGYMVGLGVSVNINTGLASFKKAQSFKERKKAMEKRIKFFEEKIVFEIEKAFSEYQIALKSLESAKARVKSAEEMVRIMKIRYENGMARIVDLLDATAQLELAKFDYINALYRCNLSYGKALYEAGIIKEVLR